MKTTIVTLFCIAFLITPTTWGLTTQEATSVRNAIHYIQEAKKQAVEQERVLQEQEQENSRLDQLAQGQQDQLIQLSGQIETSHKNEEEAARYNVYAKPIIEEVNSYWGLGAFVYGFKVLSKHLFILLAVLAVLALAVFVISLAFPPIGAALQMAWGYVVSWIRRLKK